ncbi:hypothetical protein BH11BAC3_BH11BAC3_37690 [soil metagenome]
MSNKPISGAVKFQGSFGETTGIEHIITPAFKHLPTITTTTTENITESLKGFIFEIFYHPYAELLLQTLNEQNISGLFAETLVNLNDNGVVFKSSYSPNTIPNPDTLVKTIPEEKFEFDIDKFYAKDNWFTFYHIIILIVETLLANNKNEEAIQWIENCLYNPKKTAVNIDTLHPNARFWKLPIFKDSLIENTEDFLKRIGNDGKLQKLVNSINKDPFNPFLVAYFRPPEFMMYVVTLYVKAHISQGDIHFRMAYNGGGMDELNLALEFYKIAKIQLGQQTETIPNIIKKKPETYQSLKAKGLDQQWNASVQYENIFPFCSQIDLQTGGNSNGSLLGGNSTLYFSIPPDTNMSDLYDLIDDRLTKLRSCKDIDGIIRKIDLFGTRINPAQLLAALAKGLSLGDILGGLYAPAPKYRFNFLFQKAIEACNEVKALGSNIVNAIEKSDNEYLSKLRALHETNVLNRLTPIKEDQVYETRIQKEALLKTRAIISTRLAHYQSLLGLASQPPPNYIDIPSGINADSTLPADTIINGIDINVDVKNVESDETGVKFIPKEKQEIDFMKLAAVKHDDAGDNESIAAVIHELPDLSLHTQPIGIGFSLGYGSANIAAIFSAYARDSQNQADKLSFHSNLSAKFASYIRREQEWGLQARIAREEIIQIDKQLAAADVRVQISQQELDNHKIQITEAQEVQDFIVTKDSNYANYVQITNKLKPIHKNFYDLAMYYARSAEQAYQFEKPDKVIDFVSYGYDNSIVGMATVAEKLHVSLKEMEKSYFNDIERPLEIKINIQLSRLNPTALLQLRKTGFATINIPEWLLLLKNRGIYKAKWISVNFTFPMVTGPYTNMSALVTMQNNYIRIKADGGNDVKSFEMKKDAIDNRFVQNNTPFREIIVSTGLNDQGYNLDTSASANEIYQQQYHPFVHAGFISEWSIDLNSKNKDYDYSEINWDTLADVIISGVVSVEIDNGPNYKTSAGNYLSSLFAQVIGQPLILFLDIKRDFSNELYKFKSDNAAQQLSFTVGIARFPYLAQHKKITVTGLQVITKDNLGQQSATINNGQTGFDTVMNIADYTVYNANKALPVLVVDPVNISIELDKQFADDSFLIIMYKIEMQ